MSVEIKKKKIEERKKERKNKKFIFISILIGVFATRYTYIYFVCL